MELGTMLSIISLSTLLLTISGLSIRDWLEARRDRG